MNNLKQRMLALIEKDLEDIERALERNLTPHVERVLKTAQHILFSGGKRLRPLLMILSARINGYKKNDAQTLSTVFEYLHAATLLHDDLVDDATVRRGKTVAHLIWGNSNAILVGDFLLARSLSIAAETKRLEVVKIIAQITEDMSQGEIQQLDRKGHLDLSEAEYMDLIRRKTAELLKGACRVGAIIADADKEKETALSEYGLNIGIAFQMADDLLDYTSDSHILGKEVGADLKEGKLTLPVIYSLKKADANQRAEMEDIIKNKDFSVASFKRLIEMLNNHGGIDYTHQVALKHIHRAKATLSIFKSSKTKETLLYIADYVLSRKF